MLVSRGPACAPAGVGVGSALAHVTLRTGSLLLSLLVRVYVFCVLLCECLLASGVWVVVCVCAAWDQVCIVGLSEQRVGGVDALLRLMEYGNSVRCVAASLSPTHH